MGKINFYKKRKNNKEKTKIKGQTLIKLQSTIKEHWKC